MDSENLIVNSQIKIQASQPNLTKRGLKLQNKGDNPSSEAEKGAIKQSTTHPQTSSGNNVDVTV